MRVILPIVHFFWKIHLFHFLKRKRLKFQRKIFLQKTLLEFLSQIHLYRAFAKIILQVAASRGIYQDKELDDHDEKLQRRFCIPKMSDLEICTLLLESFFTSSNIDPHLSTWRNLQSLFAKVCCASSCIFVRKICRVSTICLKLET